MILDADLEPRRPGFVGRCKPTLRYFMQTEVHVHALAMAASVLLSFFPFLIVMISPCRYGFRWSAAVNAIFIALADYFPGEQNFIKRNLVAVVESRGPMQITSRALLLITANGIFEPLEVALNRVWGVATKRSYLKNQLLSLGLIFICGGLAPLSFLLTALKQQYLAVSGEHAGVQPQRTALDQPGLLQVCGHTDIDSDAVSGVLAAPQSQNTPVARRTSRDSGGAGEGAAEIRQSAGMALARSQAAARVWPVLHFRDNRAVQLSRRHAGAGRRGTGAREIRKCRKAATGESLTDGPSTIR
ncbi:MAG: hypothetical protein DMG57_33295 [Acidobacteria bacterium]|nr:MAG: hypothetical protein DMG57_33295 [Acidobacteriota bacterium]